MSNNNTPYVRFALALTEWPETIPQEARYRTVNGDEKIPIDLSRRQLRKDFFLTNAAYFRLENFLTSMGEEIYTDDAGVKDYETPITHMTGAKVGVTVQRMLSNRGELINIVGDLIPWK